MSTPLVAPPPIHTSMLDERGRVTHPWVSWFNSLQGATSALQAAAMPPPVIPATAWGSAPVASGDPTAVVVWGPSVPQAKWQ
jgi:hypothetical protein